MISKIYYRFALDGSEPVCLTTAYHRFIFKTKNHKRGIPSHVSDIDFTLLLRACKSNHIVAIVEIRGYNVTDRNTLSCR